MVETAAKQEPRGGQPWQQDRVLLRRKGLAFAPAFQILDLQGQLLLHSQEKSLKLKEEFGVYADEAKQLEMLSIKERRLIEFSACYDVHDAQSGEHVGALRRKGFKSILRDEWEIRDGHDEVVGRVREHGRFWIHRFLTSLAPQTYALWLGESRVGEVRCRASNPFVFQAEMDLRADHGRALDRRLAMAAAILLMATRKRPVALAPLDLFAE